jgi:pimeloyl-ACP methyl ester carboxylesterase
MSNPAIRLGIPIALVVSSVAFGQETKPTKATVSASDGVKIAYEVRGKGDTALVFIHGWCGDHEYWKNQVDEFAGDYRVVALDMAGHSGSGKDRKEWTVESLAGDIETLVKELGLKRVILIGHSMGGGVALLAAKKMPGVVVGVIAVDTYQNVEFKFPEEEAKKFFDMFEKDFQGSLRALMPGMFPEKVDPEVRAWVLKKAEAQDPKMANALMRDYSRADEKAILKEAKVPVRGINSGGGFQFFVPTAVETNKKYADFKAVTIADVGHYPMLEKPKEFNEKLRETLKEFAK